MTTTSHAFFTYAFLPTGSDAALAVVGAVLPDIPFWLVTPYVALKKTGFCKEAIDGAKDIPGVGMILKAGHSFVVWLIVAILVWLLAPALMPFIWGWLGHNVADFFTHHAEAHAHFYPLGEWRFRSPISYYEWDHHALWFILAEYSLAAVVLASWARHETLATTVTQLSGYLFVAAVAVVAAVIGLRRWRRVPAEVSVEG